jgi:hypothetical protein
MPRVGTRKFGYGTAGRKAAKKHARKTGKKVVSTKGSGAKRTGRRIMVGAAKKRK